MTQTLLKVAVTVVELLFGWLKRLRNRYREQALRTAFDRASQARAALEALLLTSRADRVLLLRAHNGGGNVHTPGRELKSSVMDEAFTRDGPLPSIRADWQSQPLDEVYRAALRRLVDERVIVLRTVDMTPGALRSVYEAAGVQAAVLAHVAVIGDSYLYTSLNFTEPPANLAQARDLARAHASRIRRAFEGGRG